MKPEDIKIGSIWGGRIAGNRVRVDFIKKTRVYYTRIQISENQVNDLGQTYNRPIEIFLANYRPVYTIEGFEV